MSVVLAALLILAICATCSQQRDWRAGGAFAPASAKSPDHTTTLITRFYASAVVRQVYAVVGPVGKERKAVGDSPLGRKGEPLAVVRDECHGDGASSCAVGEFNTVGVARSARGNPCQACTNVQSEGAFSVRDGQARKGSLPEGPIQTAPPFGLVAKQ